MQKTIMMIMIFYPFSGGSDWHLFGGQRKRERESIKRKNGTNIPYKKHLLEVSGVGKKRMKMKRKR